MSGKIQCIRRVPKPKSSDDCGCTSCQLSTDDKNQEICIGDCFDEESGLSCQKRILFRKPRKYEKITYQGNLIPYPVCICQTTTLNPTKVRFDV